MVGAQGIYDRLQRFVEHAEPALLPVGAIALVAIEALDTRLVQLGRLALLQVQLFTAAQGYAHGMLQYHHTGRVGLLFDQKARAQRPRVAQCSAYDKGPRGIGGHLYHQRALVQPQQALAGREVEIDGAAGVQAQTAAVGEGQFAALAGAGTQIREQGLTAVTVRCKPGAAAEQADADQAAQYVAASVVGLQQRFAQAGRRAAHPLIGRAKAALQFLPGLRVVRGGSQPVTEGRLGCCVGAP